MNVTEIVIEGPAGDIEIIRTEDGALVTRDNEILFEALRSDSMTARTAKAKAAAREVCGPNVRDKDITRMMVEISRIANQ